MPSKTASRNKTSVARPMKQPAPEIEARATVAGLRAYVEALRQVEQPGVLSIASVLVEHGACVRVYTEVHAGGVVARLGPVARAEVAAQQAAMALGGTGPFVFYLSDLDYGERSPEHPSFERLL